MKPEIIDKPGFLVVGVRAVWNFDSQVPKMLWNDKILPRRNEIKAAPGTENSAFGVFGAIPENRNGLYEYVAGLMVLSLEDIPMGMVGWEIPEGRYASVPAQGLDNIYPAYKELTDTWLPTSGYQRVNSPVFTISSSLANPTDPAAFWLVNVKIEKAGAKSTFDPWAVE